MTARKRASDEDRSLTFAAPIRAPNVREGLRKGTQPPGHSTSAMTARKRASDEDRSVEDAVYCSARAYACSVEAHLDAEMPARMPARPAESPRHERVFINFGGPQCHGDSLTFAAPIRAPNVREGLRKAPNHSVGALVCSDNRRLSMHSCEITAQARRPGLLF